MQPWQQVWGQQQVSNNLEARQQQYIRQLEQVVSGLQSEIDAYQPISQQLSFWIQATAMKDEEITDCWNAIASLAPFVDAAQIWAQDAEMHRQLLYQIWDLYNDPGHLVYKAFDAWSQVNLTKFDLDTISELFLALLDWQNQKNGGQQGAYYNPGTPPPMATPHHAPSVPFPPIPGGGLAPQDPRMVAIDLMKSGNPDAAKVLQRMRMAGQY